MSLDTATTTDRLRDLRLAPEPALALALAERAGLDPEAERRVAAEAASLVRHLREEARPGLLETFLAEYGLSTDEGVALMCLAEALLRVPDAETADALIRDKIAGADWSRHLGQSGSPLVNASTWALMLTGRVLEAPRGLDVAGTARRLLRRMGEPVIRAAVGQAIRLLGEQFVLGADIEEAISRAAPREAAGETFSYDMLGEAARTAEDADRYLAAYQGALRKAAAAARGATVAERPGLSVKLSALHPRYETAQRARVLAELAPRLGALARQARDAGMGLNVDAEEQDRLELSLDVIGAVLRDSALAGWDGFGVVVQAYGKRAPAVIDWLDETAAALGRRLMVRLVKGAYWDGEVKAAQTLGLDGYPVFTRKAHTDVSWLACARRLLGLRPRLYPQFATHNARSVASVVEMAGGAAGYEFQRLHGMGEALHAEVRRRHGTRLRVYAPVGVHRDLLAYLVRRLLENGANSSFVHLVLDPRVGVEEAVADPVAETREGAGAPHPRVPSPALLYGPARRNARGWNPNEPAEAAALDAAMAPWRRARWDAGAGTAIRNPADPDDVVGTVAEADEAAARAAIDAAAAAAPGWAALPPGVRGDALRRAADLFEANAAELMALAVREAGKTRGDAIAELREAVDFLRFYAAEAPAACEGAQPRGVAFCISPWNFPLAIFTGQVAAALATGNAVIAKPAEQTPLIAARAVALLHEAGVPEGALRPLPGDGPRLGAAVLADPRVGVVAFTGSLPAAKAIERAMARHLPPGTPLVAETGGVNAMIADSTALPEQVVRDALASGFQSAGQRCSALRLLLLQEEVAGPVTAMLRGAMRELTVGDPWDRATDVGPLIDAEARERVAAHVARHAAAGRVVEQLPAPSQGHFLGPALIRLGAVEELTEEVFGPVVHLATFRAGELEGLVERVNALGFGLTMGLHSRVEERVRAVADRARVGNLYVNRNQIGAVVGAQPFGGEGLSGTGPKAGGVLYLRRFLRRNAARGLDGVAGTLPGPAGEANSLSLHPRGRVLCLGPDVESQARAAAAAGNVAVVPAGAVAGLRRTLGPGAALAGWSDRAAALAEPDLDLVLAGDGLGGLREVAAALAGREGPVVPLVVGPPAEEMLVRERVLSVDTTSAGGNVALLSEAG